MATFDDAKDLIAALAEVTDGTRCVRPTWLACAPEPLARSYLSKHDAD